MTKIIFSNYSYQEKNTIKRVDFFKFENINKIKFQFQLNKTSKNTILKMFGYGFGGYGYGLGGYGFGGYYC